MKKRIALALVVLTGLELLAGENEWLVPLGPPPQAAPRRINGGEGVAPLPLPATPLRRSERKRDPSPPKLLTKVIWGDTAEYKFENGRAAQVADWNQCPADLQQIMQKASGTVGTPYGSEAMSLSAFHWDPIKSPVLFFSGSRTLKFSEKQLEQLRNYVLRGGMIIADNIAGSPYFYTSFKKSMEQAFPEIPWREMPYDHPVYHMMTDVDKVKYPKNNTSDKPMLEGLYINSRIGVLLSKYGMGCGWDDREVPFLQQAVYYDIPSANKLGVNIVSYAIGYANVARESSKPELFGTLDEKHPTDEFVFAQIKHEGAWNVHSGGAAALLRRMRQDTSIKVSLKRVPVLPGKDDISSYTFLYLTGLDNFYLDDAAVSSIRQFLNRGGTLFVNNGLGLRTFDIAAKRELRRILPDAELKVIPPSHPLYSSVYKIGEVHYTPAVQRLMPDLKSPLLEGITIGGDIKVIYSPFDIEMGWQGMDHPLAKGYDPESAAQLGVNMVMYTMTH
ncbi:MAG: DUF4159 domain-containing protein [Verrucomicrobiota bacterium]